MITIQKAGLEDLDLLMDWRMEVLHEVFELPSDADCSELERENRAYYEKALQDGSHVACFARLNSEIVGCGGICIYREMPSPDNLQGGCAYLMNIYTRPQYRGKGVGRTTVKWLVDEAKREGISKIYLETTDKGRPMYKKLGFSEMKGYLKLKDG